ncbi:MAG: extracellular solute-binding protein [Thermomicrobiales bacterium]
MADRESSCNCRGVNRRSVLRAGLGGVGALGLGGGLAMSRGVTPARAQDNVTLPFWLPGGSPLFCETHTAIAATYSADNPGVVVEVQCGSDQEQFTERFLGAIAAGNPPEANVIWDTPVSFGVQGALREIQDLMPTGEYTPVENWPAGVLASVQFGDKIYGLPYTAGSYAIWYNPEMLESKGIPSDRDSFPKTWDDLRALSKEFTVWDGDRLVTAGFVPRPNDFQVTSAVWSALNGGKLFDGENQKYTIDSEENIAFFQYFVDWIDDEYHGDYAAVERSAHWGAYADDQGRPPQFQAGNLLAVELGTWGLGDIYQSGDVAIERFDLAKYPVGPGGTESVSGYWPNWLVIPAGTQHPEQAFAYLDYLSGVGVLTLFDVLPDIPTNTKVPETTPSAVIEKQGEQFAEDAINFFREQLAIATPMWDSPVQAVQLDQMTIAINAILNKQMSPQDGLAEAQRVCQAELDDLMAKQG